MIKQWLSWLTITLFVLAILFVFSGIFYWSQRPSELSVLQPVAKKSRLPKGAFEFPQEVYERIGAPLLKLQESAPTLQVPDLKQQLIYYGKNDRPDASKDSTTLYFAFTSNTKQVVSVTAGERLYLLYDRKLSPPRYTFSPQNEKTSLWMTAQSFGSEADIQLTIENEKGERISQPESNASFKLPEKEFVRYGGFSWDIDGQRVDGTLLARQKGKWYGPDKFLESHGGAEYAFSKGRNRIDFGEGSDIYSVFVRVGDPLIWEKGRWNSVEPGAESIGKPLLMVKKIDDRIMTLELWDGDGKGKVTINILKSTEPWNNQNVQMLQGAFKFIGSKTLTQTVFEINRERMVLNPFDWLLLTQKGWKKLDTEEEIDDYVKRKLTGTLFVFNGIKRKEDKQVMEGVLYSPSRVDFQEIEIPLQTVVAEGGKKKNASGKEKEEAKLTKEQETKEVVDFLEEILAPLSRPEKGIKGEPNGRKENANTAQKRNKDNQPNSKVIKK